MSDFLQLKQLESGQVTQVDPKKVVDVVAKSGEKYNLIDPDTGLTVADAVVHRDGDNLVISSEKFQAKVVIEKFWNGQCTPGDDQCFATLDIANPKDGTMGTVVITQDGPNLEHLLAGEVGTLTDGALIPLIPSEASGAMAATPLLLAAALLLGGGAAAAAAAGGGGSSGGGAAPAKETSPTPTIDHANKNGVDLSGLTPGADVKVALTHPDGSAVLGDDGQPIVVSGKADADGKLSIPASDFGDKYTGDGGSDAPVVSATQTAPGAEPSAAATAPVDTVSPVAPDVSENNDGDAVIAGPADGDTVTTTVTPKDGDPITVSVTKNPDGTFQTEPAELPNGISLDPETGALTVSASDYPGAKVSATETDPAGNASEPSETEVPSESAVPTDVNANAEGIDAHYPPGGSVTATVTPADGGEPVTVTKTVGPDGTVHFDASDFKDAYQPDADGQAPAISLTGKQGHLPESAPVSATADFTPPAEPTVDADGHDAEGNPVVTVTPGSEDTDKVTATITPSEEGKEPTTVTAEKGPDGTWHEVDAKGEPVTTPGVTVDPETGKITLADPAIAPGDKVTTSADDAAGNGTEPKETAPLTAQTEAPTDVVANADGVSGKGVPGDTITVKVGDHEATTTVDDKGNWTISKDNLGDGYKDGVPVEATQSKEGETASTPVTSPVDATAPDQPVVTPGEASTSIALPESHDDVAQVVVTVTPFVKADPVTSFTATKDGDVWTLGSDAPAGAVIDPVSGHISLTGKANAAGEQVSAKTVDTAGNESAPTRAQWVPGATPFLSPENVEYANASGILVQAKNLGIDVNAPDVLSSSGGIEIQILDKDGNVVRKLQTLFTDNGTHPIPHEQIEGYSALEGDTVRARIAFDNGVHGVWGETKVIDVTPPDAPTVDDTTEGSLSVIPAEDAVQATVTLKSLLSGKDDTALHLAKNADGQWQLVDSNGSPVSAPEGVALDPTTGKLTFTAPAALPGDSVVASDVDAAGNSSANTQPAYVHGENDQIPAENVVAANGSGLEIDAADGNATDVSKYPAGSHLEAQILRDGQVVATISPIPLSNGDGKHHVDADQIKDYNGDEVRSRVVLGEDNDNPIAVGPWGTSKVIDTIAPDAPTIEENSDDHSATVTPGAGTDTLTLHLRPYSGDDEITITVNKGSDGQFSAEGHLPDGVTLDPATGAVTIATGNDTSSPWAGADITADASDNAGNTASEQTGVVPVFTRLPALTDVDVLGEGVSGNGAEPNAKITVTLREPDNPEDDGIIATATTTADSEGHWSIPADAFGNNAFDEPNYAGDGGESAPVVTAIQQAPGHLTSREADGNEPVDTTPPTAPTIETGSEEGAASVSLPEDADKVVVTLTPYGDDQTPSTVTVTKDDSGNWTVDPAVDGASIADGKLALAAPAVAAGTEVEAKASDAAQNVASSEGEHLVSGTLDNLPVVNVTRANEDEISGSVDTTNLPDGASIVVTIDGANASFTVNPSDVVDGTWTVSHKDLPETWDTQYSEHDLDGKTVSAKVVLSGVLTGPATGETTVVDTTDPTLDAIGGYDQISLQNASEAASVTVTENDQDLFNGNLEKGGNATINLAEGEDGQSFNVSVTDEAGNVSTYTVSTPDPVTITEANVSTIHGRGQPGATVELGDGASAKVGEDGNWTWNQDFSVGQTLLVPGTTDQTATQVRAEGDDSWGTPTAENGGIASEHIEAEPTVSGFKFGADRITATADAHLSNGDTVIITAKENGKTVIVATATVSDLKSDGTWDYTPANPNNEALPPTPLLDSSGVAALKASDVDGIYVKHQDGSITIAQPASESESSPDSEDLTPPDAPTVLSARGGTIVFDQASFEPGARLLIKVEGPDGKVTSFTPPVSTLGDIDGAKVAYLKGVSLSSSDKVTVTQYDHYGNGSTPTEVTVNDTPIVINTFCDYDVNDVNNEASKLDLSFSDKTSNLYHASGTAAPYSTFILEVPKKAGDVFSFEVQADKDGHWNVPFSDEQSQALPLAIDNKWSAHYVNDTQNYEATVRTEGPLLTPEGKLNTGDFLYKGSNDQIESTKMITTVGSKGEDMNIMNISFATVGGVKYLQINANGHIDLQSNTLFTGAEGKPAFYYLFTQDPTSASDKPTAIVNPSPDGRLGGEFSYKYAVDKFYMLDGKENPWAAGKTDAYMQIVDSNGNRSPVLHIDGLGVDTRTIQTEPALTSGVEDGHGAVDWSTTTTVDTTAAAPIGDGGIPILNPFPGEDTSSGSAGSGSGEAGSGSGAGGESGSTDTGTSTDGDKTDTGATPGTGSETGTGTGTDAGTSPDTGTTSPDAGTTTPDTGDTASGGDTDASSGSETGGTETGTPDAGAGETDTGEAGDKGDSSEGDTSSTDDKTPDDKTPPEELPVANVEHANATTLSGTLTQALGEGETLKVTISDPKHDGETVTVDATVNGTTWTVDVSKLTSYESHDLDGGTVKAEVVKGDQVSAAGETQVVDTRALIGLHFGVGDVNGGTPGSSLSQANPIHDGSLVLTLPKTAGASQLQSGDTVTITYPDNHTVTLTYDGTTWTLPSGVTEDQISVTQIDSSWAGAGERNNTVALIHHPQDGTYQAIATDQAGNVETTQNFELVNAPAAPTIPLPNSNIRLISGTDADGDAVQASAGANNTGTAEVKDGKFDVLLANKPDGEDIAVTATRTADGSETSLPSDATSVGYQAPHVASAFSYPFSYNEAGNTVVESNFDNYHLYLTGQGYDGITKYTLHHMNANGSAGEEIVNTLGSNINVDQSANGSFVMEIDRNLLTEGNKYVVVGHFANGKTTPASAPIGYYPADASVSNNTNALDLYKDIVEKFKAYADSTTWGGGFLGPNEPGFQASDVMTKTSDLNAYFSQLAQIKPGNINTNTTISGLHGINIQMGDGVDQINVTEANTSDSGVGANAHTTPNKGLQDWVLLNFGGGNDVLTTQDIGHNWTGSLVGGNNHKHTHANDYIQMGEGDDALVINGHGSGPKTNAVNNFVTIDGGTGFDHLVWQGEHTSPYLKLDNYNFNGEGPGFQFLGFEWISIRSNDGQQPIFDASMNGNGDHTALSEVNAQLLYEFTHQEALLDFNTQGVPVIKNDASDAVEMSSDVKSALDAQLAQAQLLKGSNGTFDISGHDEFSMLHHLLHISGANGGNSTDSAGNSVQVKLYGASGDWQDTGIRDTIPASGLPNAINEPNAVGTTFTLYHNSHTGDYLFLQENLFSGATFV